MGDRVAPRHCRQPRLERASSDSATIPRVGSGAALQRTAIRWQARAHIVSRRLLHSPRFAVFAVACVVAAIAFVFVPVGGGNPPGFYRDESGIALNAAQLASSGRDEYGTLLPMYFRSYGDWKSAPYIYLLAGVFSVTGPSELTARVLSSVLGLVAVVILGLLGGLLSGHRSVAVATAALAAATPWLFEVTRLVFEVALEPALIALLLLLLVGVCANETWPRWRCAALGITLALIAYAYAGGRALAPLLALALVVFATGRRRRSVLLTLSCFAAALVPMALFAATNPRALFVRYSRVSGGQDQDPLKWALSTLINVVQELDLPRWVLHGDKNLRHHVGSTGSLLAAGVLLALAGVVVLLRGRRWEPFWSYVVLGCLASAVPAAISDTRIHSLRSVGLPIFLIVLAVPALTALRERIKQPTARVAVVVATILVVGQTALFHAQYAARGAGRIEAFHVEFRPVLRAALATGRGPVEVYQDDPDAMGNATWYGKLWKEPVEVLGKGQEPSPGSAVVAVEKRCARCPKIAERGIFVAYVAR